MTRSSSALILLAAALAAACVERTPIPLAEKSRQGGVDIFVTTAEAAGRSDTSELVQRYGTFEIAGRCLVVAVDGRRYTPVFASSAAYERVRAAMAGTESGTAPPAQWALGGGPLRASAEVALPEAPAGCPADFFLVGEPRPASEIDGPRETPPRPKQ
jgi:hypothetical protein